MRVHASMYNMYIKREHTSRQTDDKDGDERKNRGLVGGKRHVCCHS